MAEVATKEHRERKDLKCVVCGQGVEKGNEAASDHGPKCPQCGAMPRYSARRLQRRSKAAKRV